jgi:hypothetical protein
LNTTQAYNQQALSNTFNASLRSAQPDLAKFGMHRLKSALEQRGYSVTYVPKLERGKDEQAVIPENYAQQFDAVIELRYFQAAYFDVGTGFEPALSAVIRMMSTEAKPRMLAQQQMLYSKVTPKDPKIQHIAASKQHIGIDFSRAVNSPRYAVDAFRDAAEKIAEAFAMSLPKQ